MEKFEHCHKKVRVIAFYLPQFHPIPENDEWWGKGFTEWTNVGKAKPLFKGHYQPRVPADLGYYDLRLPEVREAQAEMARNAGIEGFMYWHYWFGNGKTLLERPFQEVLQSGKPDFPFCLGWANHSWEKKAWDSETQYKNNKLLIKQTYSGENDYRDHFNYVLNAFKDKRYIRVDNKPIFYIFDPLHEELAGFIQTWQSLSKKNGFDGIYFIGQATRKQLINGIFNIGFNGVCRDGILDAIDKIKNSFINSILGRLRGRYNFMPIYKFRYSDFINRFDLPEVDNNENVFPVLIPNFDHSPRSGRKGFILANSTPQLFRKHVQTSIQNIKNKSQDHQIIFLRSWNEWGEGNYVEPDLVFGHGYLNILKDEILKHN